MTLQVAIVIFDLEYHITGHAQLKTQTSCCVYREMHEETRI